MLGGVGTGLPN